MGFNKHLLSFRVQGNKACICIVTMAPRLGWLSMRAFPTSHPLLYLKVVLLSTQELEKRAWLGMESLSEWKWTDWGHWSEATMHSSFGLHYFWSLISYGLPNQYIGLFHRSIQVRPKAEVHFLQKWRSRVSVKTFDWKRWSRTSSLTLNVVGFDCSTFISLSTITPISFWKNIISLLSTAWWNYKLGSYLGFPGDASGKEPTYQCRDFIDPGSIPGLGRSLREGHGNQLQ